MLHDIQNLQPKAKKGLTLGVHIIFSISTIFILIIINYKSIIIMCLALIFSVYNFLSINIIIKEYLNSSNFFLEDSQTKYLNALLDNVGKKLRTSNA